MFHNTNKIVITQDDSVCNANCPLLNDVLNHSNILNGNYAFLITMTISIDGGRPCPKNRLSKSQ